MADDPVTLEIVDNPGRHRYEAFAGEALAGFVTYDRTPGAVVFIHTETVPAFEGHGVGSHLAQAALDDARARHEKVTPRCPFIAAYIDRHPAYADLLDHRP
jgi:predicted GNAT family acetyltransferase